MKYITLIAFFIFGINVKAQITIEHRYDSASTNSSPAQSTLMIINFEISGDRYVNINRAGKKIEIFDLNHSLVKTISVTNLAQGCGSGNFDILYLSEQLFDTDSQMEFMYLYANCSNLTYVKIYKEDGTLIFAADSMFPIISLKVPQQQQPIYNTTQGAKLIMSEHQSKGNGAIVYSLPGTLSTAIAEANGQLMQMQGGQGQLSNLYPNPSNGAVTIQYELPKGEQYGEIVLYDMRGSEIKRYKVGNTFKDILLDNTILPAGTYFWQLQTAKGAVGTKKMVVVK